MFHIASSPGSEYLVASTECDRLLVFELLSPFFMADVLKKYLFVIAAAVTIIIASIYGAPK